MLIFVFLVATLNLGVGYVLGKGLGLRDLQDQVLALLPARKKKPLDEDIDDAPLSRPAPPIDMADGKQDSQAVLASLASMRDELNAASTDVKAESEPADAGATDEQPIDQTEEEAGAAGEVEAVTDTKEEASGEVTQGASDAEVKTDGSRPMASIDELFNQLEASLAKDDDQAVRHVAAIRVDAFNGEEADRAVVEGIAKVAAELLADAQPFVGGSPVFALLNGDSFDEAKERLNEIRQRVEAEEEATVTCAFTDARRGDAREQVLIQLNSALEESGRFGTNRTYHHDGAFPTPVDEPAAAESTEVEADAAEPVA